MMSPGSHPPRKRRKKKTDISRESEIRQSKTKRVKNYLKKCKNVLGSRSATLEVSSTSEYASATSSWYLEEKIEQNLNECEINELEEVFEDAQDNLVLGQCDDLYQVANIVEVKGPSVESAGSEKINDSDYKNENDAEHSYEQSKDSQRDASEPNGPETASPNLKKSQVEEVGNVEGEKIEVKEEVEAEITLKLTPFNMKIVNRLTLHYEEH
ncbi:hypothetical protein NQ317_000761 [Molorchus minor]|uniref:Uncharacterized protein n=1 Tax=Molorchus minor TaxID=1323400 RepID=A0ABQ9IYZ7_9CUCU|nr:hypothetical protein NQ317_000761 [Molorchus minor]